LLDADAPGDDKGVQLTDDVAMTVRCCDLHSGRGPDRPRFGGENEGLVPGLRSSSKPPQPVVCEVEGFEGTADIEDLAIRKHQEAKYGGSDWLLERGPLIIAYPWGDTPYGL
jgi:hypothetical protein